MNKRKTPKANLENKRVIFLEIGFILSLAFVLFAFEYKTFDKIVDLNEYYNNYNEKEELAPLVFKKEQEMPKKPVPKTILNIVDNTEEPEIEIEIDANIGEDDEIIDYYPPEEPEEIIEEDPLPLYEVSKHPEFPGGEAAMMRFLSQNFRIPKTDKEMGNQGKIYVGFVIDKDGNVKNVHIERGLSPTADAEAIRVVKLMPQWKPAQQGIKKVSVKFVLPIHVKLM